MRLLQGFIVLTLLVYSSVCDAYLMLGYTAGRGLGFNQGYATIGLSDYYYLPIDSRPFFDFRANWFARDMYAFNFGTGWRTQLGRRNVIFGANVFYDYLNKHENSYNQLGAGLELFWCGYELRLNGYLPFGRKEHVTEECIFNRYEGDFVISNTKSRVAMRGFDGEIGANTCYLYPYNLYVGVGGYYYQGDTCRGHKEGAQVRLSSWLMCNLNLELKFIHDSDQKRLFQAVIAYYIPLGCSCCINKPIERNNIILTDTRCDWDWNFGCSQDCSCGCNCSSSSSYCSSSSYGYHSSRSSRRSSSRCSSSASIETRRSSESHVITPTREERQHPNNNQQLLRDNRQAANNNHREHRENRHEANNNHRERKQERRASNNNHREHRENRHEANNNHRERRQERQAANNNRLEHREDRHTTHNQHLHQNHHLRQENTQTTHNHHREVIHHESNNFQPSSGVSFQEVSSSPDNQGINERPTPTPANSIAPPTLHTPQKREVARINLNSLRRGYRWENNRNRNRSNMSTLFSNLYHNNSDES